MDDQRFDSLVMALTTNGGPRRRMLQALGASGLAAVTGRLGLADDAEAKKKGKKKRKKKKCKGGTTKCGKKACCQPDQDCVNGKCVDQGGDPECVNDSDCDPGETCTNGQCIDVGEPECEENGDCAANESCIGGQCVCDFPQKPCGGACCASDEACFNGECVVGQGTCAAGEDICAGDAGTCNGDASCTCGIRFDDGEPRCIQFVDVGKDNCTCAADFRCEEDFGPGTICIKGGANCPNCTTNTLGRCARLCSGSL
jgi:hypothetical protein